jgi:hypothetical protein
MPIMSAENIAASLMPLGNAGKWPEVPPGITIFCDLDGPLVDVSKRYYKTYQLAIAETQAYLQRRGKRFNLHL